VQVQFKYVSVTGSNAYILRNNEARDGHLGGVKGI